MSTVENGPERTGLEIAVVGMCGRFPGARDVEQLWSNLRAGVDAITFFGDEELLAAGVDPALLTDPSYVKAGGVLADVEMFDASFFGFTPREAEVTDPQQRFFLEGAWEALENAGYDPERANGEIGVYAGVGMSSYYVHIYPSLGRGAAGSLPILNNDKDFLATRVSYKLNLKGPSLTVQTACSTSLVAVHLARHGLLSGECDIALAGGVKIRTPQVAGYFYQPGGITSPDGRCRAFDAAAQGSVGGSGMGLVVLKRLDDALADGDHIRGLILGSALNNDGAVKVGYTAPSVEGQAKVIRAAQIAAGVEPDTIGYVEAHGTGTALGDPIEIAALTRAFRARTKRKSFCAVGSIKTNVGHLDAAAGVTGLIKTILTLEHGEVPPSLNYERPNPNIDFAESPFYVNAELSEWKAGDAPRRAAVSSFGIGGTNVHVIAEQAPRVEPSGTSRAWQFLPLSARTESALEKATANLLAHLKQHGEATLADIAYTLKLGRKGFPHRRIIVCSAVADAVEALEARDGRRVLTAYAEQSEPGVVFMFPGQGAQYVNMTAELYRSEPAFSDELDRCLRVLDGELGLGLRETLFPRADLAEEARRRLNQTEMTQPALFAVEYALARMWMSWGVRPKAAIGHSVGEYVAACVAGVLSLEDALRLIAARGRLMQLQPAGAMLAVGLERQQAEARLRDGLSLAAVNGPRQCVVSGTHESVAALEAELAAAGVVTRQLETSHAFHSAMMDGVLDEFRTHVERAAVGDIRVPYVSNLTGTWATAQDVKDSSYWARQLRETVRFADGAREVAKTGAPVWLEVGPGQTLTRLLSRQDGSDASRAVLPTVGGGGESGSEVKQVVTTLGRLWLAGVEVDWSAYYAGERRLRVPLPTYPFERQRYWIERAPAAGDAQAGAGAGARAADLADWFYLPVWKRWPLIKPPRARAETDAEARWLVFADDVGLWPQLESQLAPDGVEAVTVVRGESFAELGERAYALNPAEAGQYDRLLKELALRDRLPGRVVHLWGLTPEEEDGTTLGSFEAAQYAGFYSLLFAAQALEKNKVAHPIRLDVVTSRIYDVTGDDPVRPERATALGAVKVIPRELPQVTCRLIDVDRPARGSRWERRLVASLAEELAGPGDETPVAYRHGVRWQQVFDAVRLDAAPADSSPLKEGGVYLVMNGADDVGLEIAARLAATAKAKLALIVPRSFPARELSDEALKSADNATARRIGRLRELEESGAQALICQANFNEAEELRQALALAEQKLGAVSGLFFTPPLTEQRPLRGIGETGQADCEWHFYSKVGPLLALDAALGDRPLDFCLVVSSNTSLLGAVGAAAYCAATAFADAFARRKSAEGDSVFRSVNFDNWEIERRADGASPPTPPRGRATAGVSVEDGTEALLRALSVRGCAQVVVSGEDFNRRSSASNRRGTEAAAGPETAPAAATHARPEVRQDYVPAGSHHERVVVDIFKEFLGYERVGVHDDFFELGGDSLTATRVATRVQQAFKVDVPLARFFESPTPAGIAAAIAEKQIEAAGEHELADMVAEIQQLSEEELLSLLNEDSE